MQTNHYKFSEIAINFDKKRIPLSAMEREKRKGEYRYYGAQGIIDYIDDYIFDGKYLLIAEDGENLKSNKQNIAQIVNGKFWVNNHAHIIQTNDKCNIDYLNYYLNSTDISGYITGSAQPKLSQANLNNIDLVLPDIKIQEKITSILLTIDEKIAINSATNNNLEQQAQAIFKSWFVDFEPFGGTMPKDWKNGNFAEIIEHTISGDWGKDFLTGNNTQKVYCIRGADIPEVRIGNKGKMPYRYILPKNYFNKKLTDGDLVIEISGGSPTQSTGRIAAITNYLLERYDEGMVCTNFCKAIKPKNKYSMFIYYYWLYLYRKNVFFSYENGTTGIKNLDISGFIETEPIVIPNADILIKFDEICKNFEKIIFSNGYENEQLTQLRDTLLPKLMNGEIDVSEVEISTDKLYEPANESKLSAEPYNSSGSFASASKNLPSEQSSSTDKLLFSILVFEHFYIKIVILIGVTINTMTIFTSNIVKFKLKKSFTFDN